LLIQQQKNDIVSTVSTTIYDAGMAYALTSDAFQVCISLTNVAGSRKMQASTNTTMNISYFGNQNASTVGTLTTNKSNKVQSRGSSAGMIAGAVIGSILGCFLLIVIAFFIIFVVTWTKRSVKVKKQQASFELLNSPAKIQFDQEPMDIESSVKQNEDVEQEQEQLTESVLQDDDNDKQVYVMEATNIQDTLIIEEIKSETAIDDVMLDLSDNITLEPMLHSTEVTTSNTTSDHENIPIQLDA
jgi:hypothetical protein